MGQPPCPRRIRVRGSTDVRPTSCNSAASARGRAAEGRLTDALGSLQLLVRRRQPKAGWRSREAHRRPARNRRRRRSPRARSSGSGMGRRLSRAEAAYGEWRTRSLKITGSVLGTPLPRVRPAKESDWHKARRAASAERLANQLRAQEGGGPPGPPTEGDRLLHSPCWPAALPTRRRRRSHPPPPVSGSHAANLRQHMPSGQRQPGPATS